MAKPIEPTPVLKGEDIRKFYEAMHKEDSNPDPKRLRTITRSLEVFSRISRK